MSTLYKSNNGQFISEASNTFVAVLDGAKIATLDAFYKSISQALNFPDYFGENLDALDELLYDLDWIEQDQVILLITESAQLLSQEPLKKQVIEELIQQIDNPYFEVCFL